MINKRTTSIDVAKLAGVSQSTVSRTFTPGATVSESARQKVLAAAAELGYQPNAIARSLSKQHTNIVGIIMGRITSPFHPYVLEKIIKDLQGVGKQALLFSTPPESKVDDLFELVLQYQVGALLVTAATISPEMADVFARNGTPVVLFNRYVLGAMDAARHELGTRIPDELSIVGFGDISAAAWTSYSLTTIRMPVNCMIDAAVEVLLKQQSEPANGPAFKLIPGTLIARNSARLPDGFTNPAPM